MSDGGDAARRRPRAGAPCGASATAAAGRRSWPAARSPRCASPAPMPSAGRVSLMPAQPAARPKARGRRPRPGRLILEAGWPRGTAHRGLRRGHVAVRRPRCSTRGTAGVAGPSCSSRWRGRWRRFTDRAVRPRRQAGRQRARRGARHRRTRCCSRAKLEQIWVMKRLAARRAGTAAGQPRVVPITQVPAVVRDDGHRVAQLARRRSAVHASRRRDHRDRWC